jgi:WD40 repeat protein
VITFRPHTAWVTALAFSPDGRALVSVSHDHTVKMWDVTGLAHRELRWEVTDRAGLNHCQFAASGTELFTGGLDGCVRVWSAADGKLLRASEPTPDDPAHTAVFAFVLSRDGRNVAWCGRTERGPPSLIVIADTKTLTAAHCIPAHQDDGRILVARPDGLCSVSKDKTVKFWDWNTQTCHRTLKLRGVTRGLAVAPDGGRLAVGGVTTITVHRLAGHDIAGKPVHFRGHTKRVECIEFSPDGARLASASADGTLRLWDAATGECARAFALKLGPLHWVTFAPDGLTVAFSSVKGDIGLLDLDD